MYVSKITLPPRCLEITFSSSTFLSSKSVLIEDFAVGGSPLGLALDAAGQVGQFMFASLFQGLAVMAPSSIAFIQYSQAS